MHRMYGVALLISQSFDERAKCGDILRFSGDENKLQ